MENTNEMGINTSDIEPEELQKLVDNNQELIDGNEISNIDKEVKETKLVELSSILNQKQTHMINDLYEKDNIINLLRNSNNELEFKIKRATDQYDEIISKLKPNTEYEILSQKVKEIDKEIIISNNETENYKKQIDNLKNKIEFKNNLEKAISLENLLKLETNKNKDIKRELDSLNRVHSLQIKALDNYDKENRFSEKIEILKAEIKLIKDNLKELIDKHSKQDKYLKHIHEKLISVENLSKKLLIPKIEYRKSFTKDELKNILDEMNTIKNKIEENRRNLKQMNKMYEDKLNKYVTLNKKIEFDYKENIKMNKMLIMKKNELKRLIKSSNDLIVKKNDKNLLNEDISHLIKNKSKENNFPKLFAKNPNKEEDNDEIQNDIEVDENNEETNEVYEESNEYVE